MNDNFYYTAPSDEIFEEMKDASMEIWNSYDDPYKTEKVNRIKDLQNIQDNFMYMLAMFDSSNQSKVIRVLSKEAKDAVRKRLIVGGNDTFHLILLGLYENEV